MRRRREHYGLWAALFGIVALISLTLLIGGISISIHFLMKVW